MLFAAVALTVAFGMQDAVAQPEPMACEVGPVTRTYGQSGWLVYGCSDKRSLVFVSAPGNPAKILPISDPKKFSLSPAEEKSR